MGNFSVAKQSGRDWLLYKPLLCYQAVLNELILACVSSYPIENLPDWKLGAVLSSKWVRSWGWKSLFFWRFFGEVRIVWKDVQSFESYGVVELCHNKIFDQEKIFFDWEAVFHYSFFSICGNTRLPWSCSRLVYSFCKSLKVLTLFNLPICPFFLLGQEFLGLSLLTALLLCFCYLFIF